MNPLLLVWLGAGLNLLAGLHYAHRTVRAPGGDAAQPKPNPMSWGIWSLSGWLAFLGQVSEGVGGEALLTLSVAAVPTIIVLAALVGRKRYGAYAPVGRLDLVCCGLAVVTLIAWRATASGSVAVALSIVCEALVAVPVVLQAYRDPTSDSPTIWVAGAVSGVLTLATVSAFTFLTSGFAVYFLILCLLMSFLLVVRPRLRSTAADAPAGSGDAAKDEAGGTAGEAGAAEDEAGGAEVVEEPGEATTERRGTGSDGLERGRWHGHPRRAGRRGRQPSRRRRAPARR